MVNRRKIQLGWLVFIMFTILSCNIFEDQRATELHRAYERSRRVIDEALITENTDRLSQVLTGELLESTLQAFERERDKPREWVTLADREFESFWIEEYDENRAVFRGTQHYRRYNLYLDTGKKDYFYEDWSRVRITMLKEDDVWKIADIESKRAP